MLSRNSTDLQKLSFRGLKKMFLFPAFVEIMLLHWKANYFFFFVLSWWLQLIATAVLFLASKSEETPCPLNDVLRVSCEILHKQDFSLLSFMLPIVSILSILSVPPCLSLFFCLHEIVWQCIQAVKNHNCRSWSQGIVWTCNINSVVFKFWGIYWYLFLLNNFANALLSPSRAFYYMWFVSSCVCHMFFTCIHLYSFHVVVPSCE